MKINTFFLILNLILYLNLISCSTDSVLEPVLKLELEDVSCTEAWLQLTTNNIQLPATLQLLTNNTVTKVFELRTKDSLLHIDSLLPNQTYKLQVSIIQNQVFSKALSVTTMDTTSHNFTWQILTWGNSGSSTLFDVAIINENDIWAVGIIKIADSSVNGYTKYNAVHWNGITWELKKIKYYKLPCSIIEYPEIVAIWAFSENNFALSDGGTVGWFDGTNVTVDCEVNPLLIGTIKKMWGTSNSDLYAVGYSGNIIQYNGTNWSKIESGTTLNINDIWGDYNSKTKEWEILAVASNEYSSFDRELIKINKTSSILLSKSGIEEPLHGIWFKPNEKYYAVGSGTYEKTHLNDPEWKGDPLDLTEYFENNVRAKDLNDVVSVGAFGEILHFNGYNWKSYISETYLQNGTLLSVDIKNNLVVATGWISQQAVLIIGKR